LSDLRGEGRELDALGVREDACNDAVGQFQGAASSGTVHDWNFAGADAIEEGAELGTQRLFGRSGNFFEANFRKRAAGLNADTQNVLAREIERNVFVFLEEAHLADAFGGNAAGGEVRNRAVREFEASVGDVDFVRDYRDADGFHVLDRRIHEREEYVEVMDHDIVDYVNIETAGRENSHAMDFEKHRLGDNLLDGYNGGIEAFDLPDLENAAEAFCGCDQLVGFVKGGGDRFFDEHVVSRFEKLTPDSRVLFRRHGKTHGIHFFGGEHFDAVEDLGGEFRGDFLRALGICIHNSGKLRALHLAPKAYMVAAEFTGAYNSNANGFVAHDFFFFSGAALPEAGVSAANAWIAMFASSAE
jgi:hypothetical protein